MRFIISILLVAALICVLKLFLGGLTLSQLLATLVLMVTIQKFDELQQTREATETKKGGLVVFILAILFSFLILFFIFSLVIFLFEFGILGIIGLLYVVINWANNWEKVENTLFFLGV